MLGSASDWLQNHGRVREGLQVLEPFLAEAVRRAMTPERVGRLLGTVGIAYYRLGQVERAIGFYEQRLVIAREIGDRRGEGIALGNLGIAYADLGQVERAIDFYEQHWSSPARSATGAARGTPWATWASPTPTWARWSGPSDSTSRTWSSLARSATGGARGTPWATWASPTPTWARWSGPSTTTSSTWSSPARSATGGARGTPWATWASPTPTWARWSGPSTIYEQALVIAREIGDRRGEGNALGNLGIAYAPPGPGGAGHRLLRAELWSSPARSATGGARGTPWATWASPTPTWARWSGPSALLEQALRIGEEIKDPRIIQIVTAHLERLRSDGATQNPEKC